MRHWRNVLHSFTLCVMRLWHETRPPGSILSHFVSHKMAIGNIFRVAVHPLRVSSMLSLRRRCVLAVCVFPECLVSISRNSAEFPFCCFVFITWVATIRCIAFIQWERCEHMLCHSDTETSNEICRWTRTQKTNRRGKHEQMSLKPKMHFELKETVDDVLVISFNRRISLTHSLTRPFSRAGSFRLRRFGCDTRTKPWTSTRTPATKLCSLKMQC